MTFIFANWKMYLDFDESNILANTLLKESFDFKKINLAVFPSTLAIREISLALQGSKIGVGAQDAGYPEKGAYTGQVSAWMLKNIGCKYSLVGHSERRHVFGESNEIVRKKTEACLEANLIPVVCIGETKEEKDEGKREYRLKKQLMKAFKDLDGHKTMVAYEPVWAIGTGEACKPEEAEEVHAWIKLELKQYFDQEIPVLYGGSVNAENVVSYLALENCDGVLVGGASAKIDTFLPLIRAVEGL